VLFSLLKELAKLFHYFYYIPTLDDAKAIKKFEQYSNYPELSKFLTINLITKAQNRLINHTFVIDSFARHLAMDWPVDDTAEEQELYRTDDSGVELAGKVFMTKLKHALDIVREVSSHKRRRVSQSIRMASEELESEEPGDEETESDDLTPPTNFGSSSLTALSCD
jgi:hypothetical protein